MPRNMSFAMTADQVRNRSKDVTRRFGWWFLKPGEQLWAVEKSMGLKKGEKVVRLALIEVVSAWGEPLNSITVDDCGREGFPDLKPDDFIQMLCKHYGCPPNKPVNRIEFRYL